MNKYLPPKKNDMMLNSMNSICVTSLIIVLILLSPKVSGQARLLKDVNLEEEVTRNEYVELTPGSGMLYFISNKTELWKTTGTPGGTSRLKAFKSVKNLTIVGYTVFFVADDGFSGPELWKSNGTTTSTVKVKDILEGSTGSIPQELVSLNGVLYFSALSKSGREVWKSDGTEAGTVLVKDIALGTASSNPSGFTPVNNTLYFSATNTTIGNELWKTDGTTEGTTIVKDITEGNGVSSSPQMLINVGGILYFSAEDLSGRELWKSNGTTVGTVKVKDIFPGGGSSSIDNLTNVEGVLFFSADDGQVGQELWKSDGTAAGTVLVKDMTPGEAGSHGEDPFMAPISNFTNIKGSLYFTAYQNDTYYIWRSDGTTAGTTVLQPSMGPGINTSLPLFTFLNNYIYYFNAVADDYNSTLYLWRMDLTGGNHTRIRIFYTPDDYYELYHQEMVRFNNQLFTTGRINPSSGYELIKSNGTSVGTVTLKDAYVPTLGSEMDQMTRISDLIYFTAKSSNHTRSVWRTNGTAIGTIELATLTDIYNVEAVGDKLFFTGYDSSVGWQLWKSDGTIEGTVLIKEQSGPYDPTPLGLTDVGNALYFYNARGELFKIDGATGVAVLLKDFSGISSIYESAGKLFMMIRNNTDGLELWKSDGSGAGTVRVKTIRNYTGREVYYTPTITIGNFFYFIADDGIHGNEVWRSDGTASGTHMVIDLREETDYNPESDIRSLGYLNNELFISGLDNDGNWSLFRSNGTSTGTYKLTEMNPIILMVSGKDNLFLFTADFWYSDWANALWVSRGSSPEYLTDLNASGKITYDFIDGVLYFNSESYAMKRSDGTPCGTIDVDAGVESPYPLMALGTSLIFGAYDYFADREPHVFDTKQISQNPCSDKRVSSASALTKGVESFNAEDVASHYPNPFKEDFVLRVNGKDNAVAQVDVFTSLGVQIEAFNNLVCNKDYRVGTTWPSGIYILKIQTSEGFSTSKIAKE